MMHTVIHYKMCHMCITCLEELAIYCVLVKGIVHLNIIFSYMKVNKICNLDHPVY